MNREPQTDLRGFSSVLEKLLTIHVKDTAIVVFTDIRLEHRSRVRTESAIHKDFDGADAQPVITKTCAQTKLIRLIE
jgi:hypothetical protein